MAIARISAAVARRLGLTPADFVDDATQRSKYHSTRTTVDGITFDSKFEANRYGHLRYLQTAGLIHSLERQVDLEIYAPMLGVNGEVIGLRVVSVWRADFRYVNDAGETVVEDAKGFRTRLYQLKKKCVETQYGFRIAEVSASRPRARAVHRRADTSRRNARARAR